MQKTLTTIGVYLVSLSPLLAQVDSSAIPKDTEIKTTKSGLKYSVLKAGTGPKAKVGDRVVVHYTGWLTNGTQFDSSRTRGNPFNFVVGSGVIQGWSEGAQLMSKGARFKFTIPPALGYGAGGAGGGQIPPNATLIFDIEILDIVALPKFKKANKAAQKTTKSGLKYEILAPGKGELPKNDCVFSLNFAYWSTEGRLLQHSANPEQRLKRSLADMPVKFLKEAVPMFKIGTRMRFEVPKKIGLTGYPGDTVWEVELVEVKVSLALPKFAMSAPEKTKTTASGLKYEVIKAGEGKHPKAHQTVKVHYAGWLTDGTLFDASYSRGEAAEFPLNGVIRGWTEGIQLMKPGSAFKFTIPGKLAYGSQGSPPKIGPDATLVFHVELLEIK